jgi:hypothetical protein
VASIVFTDAVGAATLTNGKNAPADRFSNWVTDSQPIGESAARQSDGAITMFRFRDEFGARFSLARIPVVTTGGVRLVDVAARLVYHLLNGGTCAVNTADAETNSYATCGLKPGTTPSLELADPQNLEYTLTLALINLAGSPARMVCHYRA